MSLAVAIHTPAGFVVAADSRVFPHSAAMARTVNKTLMIGNWVAAWVGDMAVAQAFVANIKHPATQIDDLLRAAYTTTLETHGAKRDDGTRYLDLDVIAAGKGGIVIQRGSGALFVIDDGFAAIGCADEWATGYWDSRGMDDDDTPDRVAAEIVRAATLRYPGVGLPITTLGG